MKYTLQLGSFPIVELKQASADNWVMTVAIGGGGNVIHAHSVIPFKPNLKRGDKITLYTEVERDAKEDN